MAIINKIESHLDNIDKIKEDIKADIERLFKKLNIKNTIDMPGSIIDVLIFAITTRITKKYIKPIYTESKRYVDNILKDKVSK